MKSLIKFLIIISVIANIGFSYGEEPIEKDSKLIYIGMFKNGVSLIKEEFEIEKPGTYVLENIPSPIHGTFWIESHLSVKASVVDVELTKKVKVLENTVSDEIQNAQVTILFKDNKYEPLTGHIMKLFSKPSAGAVQPQYYDSGWGYRTFTPPSLELIDEKKPEGNPTINLFEYLILKTEKGIICVDKSLIAMIKVNEKVKIKDFVNVKTKKQVLKIIVEKCDKKQKVHMTYLTRGISWAPSYKVDISNNKKLVISQKAVIRNELKDFKDVELELISGFPSIKFQDITSPMGANMNWDTFVRQFNNNYYGRSSSNRGIMTQAVFTNVASPMRNSGSDKEDIVALGGEIDLHYQKIGKMSLSKNESFMFETGKGITDYEKVVEWVIPNTRNDYGSYISKNDGEKNFVWDTLVFKNPLPFPMTTAPAITVGENKFYGQQMLFWTNQTAKAYLHVTKSLSIRTMSSEEELENARKEIRILGQRCWETTVKGELKITNFRKKDVRMLIKREFFGELIEADDKPTTTLLKDGAYLYNKHNQLSWDIELKSGEEKIIKFKYKVYIRY